MSTLCDVITPRCILFLQLMCSMSEFFILCRSISLRRFFLKQFLLCSVCWDLERVRHQRFQIQATCISSQNANSVTKSVSCFFLVDQKSH